MIVMLYSIENTAFKYKNTYYKFPQSLKTFIGSLYGNIPLSIRFGHTFTTHRDIIEKFESGNTQYQMDFIYNKTLETLIFAEENIPYYKKLFQEHALSAQNFKSLDDLKKFPTLSKQLLKDNLNIMHTNLREKPVAYFTGGSTSIPTKLFLPQSSRSKEKAYNNYIFSKLGYHYRDKTLLIKGREISIPEKDIYWEYEPIDNYFLLSNNYMNSDKFPLMYQKTKIFNPKFIFGYPSAILSFIKQCKLRGYEKLNINGVILSSETIYPNELQMIRKFFGVDVLTHYGHTERTVIGYRINNNHYNFLNSYGVPRIVDNEIVATSFDNFVMPFINYKTYDHISGNIKYYPESDIAHHTENIEGRNKDFLVTDDNRLISITMIWGGIPQESINDLQYIQKEKGKVTVLVTGNNINPNKVRSDMLRTVRNGIYFDVKVVKKIEKSSRGKRNICKQSLDIESIRNEISQKSLKSFSEKKK